MITSTTADPSPVDVNHAAVVLGALNVYSANHNDLPTLNNMYSTL